MQLCLSANLGEPVKWVPIFWVQKATCCLNFGSPALSDPKVVSSKGGQNQLGPTHDHVRSGTDKPSESSFRQYNKAGGARWCIHLHGATQNEQLSIKLALVCREIARRVCRGARASGVDEVL